MKNKTLEIAVAAFLHDIGKFVQRISHDMGQKLPSDYPINLFQPKISTGYSHAHASYTDFFIKNQLKDIPEIEDLESFASLAAKHHMENNTPREHMILVADRLSAGVDRKSFESSEAREIPYGQYRKTRMMSIFDMLDGKISDYHQRRFQYDLAEWNEDSIFPTPAMDVAADYSTLAKGFNKDIECISHKNLKQWFRDFDNLSKKWMSFIPSASVEKVIPDISLYDHARTTSALAQALYVYHTQQDEKLVKARIKDKSVHKFLYFKAKFNGIQNFIFSSGGQTAKNAAKLLRGRSFYISLIMRKLADFLCDSLALAHTAIIMNAAGSFTAILPNTELTKDVLNSLQKKVNEWLIEQFYGEVSISFAYVEASGEDFEINLASISELLAKKIEITKFQKLSVENLGVINKYFDHQQTPCPFCGKRPAHKDGGACQVCEDIINLGKNLPLKKEVLLKSKIFGIYDYVRPNEYDELYVPLNADCNPKTFEELVDNPDSPKGVIALGVLKADIDNLGEMFRKISSEGGLSRQVTFSRMIDSFWSLWLPTELKKNSLFKDIYTVFSGGDDLFLIGRWDNIIDFAGYLKEKFSQYTCYSPNMSLSAGIAILKPGEVIAKFYDLSEQALEKSKAYINPTKKEKEKNALTLFGETIPWEKKDELLNCYNDIEELISEEKLNSGALSKLMQFIDMAQKADGVEKILQEKENFSYQDMQNFKWKALLAYFISRNEKIKKADDRKVLIEKFVDQIENSEKRSILKTMIWKNIYENRRRN